MTRVTCRLTAKNGIRPGTLRSVIEYGLPLSFYLRMCVDSLQCFDAVGWAAGRASGL